MADIPSDPAASSSASVASPADVATPPEVALGVPPPHVMPSIAELFAAFFTMSIHGFGGVLPWARREIVDVRRWMAAEEFNEAFALCQFLPGPNIVNFSIVYGSRLHGPAGAIAAFVGLVGPPVVIVLALGMLYARYGDVDALRRILAGLAAAAAGLIVATAVKMTLPLVRGKLSPAPFIALAGFAAIGVMRWSLPLVLLLMAPLSIALAWWMRR